jgi:DNA topoisomerase-1
MSDPVRVVAGECTVRERAASETEARTMRGRVVVVVKPDDTVLVHDTDGYQPVAWLTRADGVSWESDGEFALTARKDDRVLLVTAHDSEASVCYDATAAGLPVGDCRCGGPLVRADGRVRCLDCGEQYGLPRDATVLEAVCDCGLPRFAAERGERFELCLDRDCGTTRSLDEAARETFDREWVCPACGADLRVIRRGGLLLGCERYPDCETGFALPTGTVAGECDCGLPVFDTGSGRRCVDSTCDLPPPGADRSTDAAAESESAGGG